MKHLPLLLILMTSAPAQTDLSRVLGQGIKSAVDSLEPMKQEDRKVILDATAELLAKHVTFRPDGTAASFHAARVGPRGMIEWKKLVVTFISRQPVSEADRLNGIHRRFAVGLGCDAHRTWDHRGNAWGPWQGLGSGLFPSGLVFEWNGKAWTCPRAKQLKAFTPGLGQSIASAKAPLEQTGGKDTDLPPGMRRRGAPDKAPKP